MATAICFKSESSDTYLFVTDKEDYTSVEDLVQGLSEQWYVQSEPLYIEGILTHDFNQEELADKVNTLLENAETY